VGALTVVAGVSGAGKSSLVHGSLVPALLADFGEASEKEGAHWDELRNADQFERFLEIDQSPIGRTPSSTPASYLGIFTDIRKTFATVPDAAARGWGPSHFSFNTKGGRCEVCEGKGYLKIPMNFLPDAKSLCEECGGKRYSEETCSVLFKELSIADVLDLTLLQAREIFSAHRKISRVLDYVILLGLGYIKLGQPTFTLSGGEAQRMKIARELGGREAKDTLYVFDEPTTGLHMNDVEKLMQVVELLLERDNTVVIIEHNLDVIRQADHLIEVGPGPGSEGGEIVYQGPPAGLLKQKKETATKRFLSPRNSQRREVVNS